MNNTLYKSLPKITDVHEQAVTSTSTLDPEFNNQLQLTTQTTKYSNDPVTGSTASTSTISVLSNLSRADTACNTGICSNSSPSSATVQSSTTGQALSISITSSIFAKSAPTDNHNVTSSLHVLASSSSNFPSRATSSAQDAQHVLSINGTILHSSATSTMLNTASSAETSIDRHSMISFAPPESIADLQPLTSDHDFPLVAIVLVGTVVVVVALASIIACGIRSRRRAKFKKDEAALAAFATQNPNHTMHDKSAYPWPNMNHHAFDLKSDDTSERVYDSTLFDDYKHPESHCASDGLKFMHEGTLSPTMKNDHEIYDSKPNFPQGRTALLSEVFGAANRYDGKDDQIERPLSSAAHNSQYHLSSINRRLSQILPESPRPPSVLSQFSEVTNLRKWSSNNCHDIDNIAIKPKFNQDLTASSKNQSIGSSMSYTYSDFEKPFGESDVIKRQSLSVVSHPKANMSQPAVYSNFASSRYLQSPKQDKASVVMKSLESSDSFQKAAEKFYVKQNRD